jgi:outer membrane protein OmpA-like peptidoglycan-associated protein
MQPRFAALLFVLGLADLAYVNLGLGHEIFGDAASGAARSAGDGPSVATPSAPTPGTPAPALTPSTPPPPEAAAPEAPRPEAPAAEAAAPEAPAEATALPEPAPQVDPPGEPAPSVEPAQRPDAPGEPARSADAVPGSPRPAQAGFEAEPLRDVEPTREVEALAPVTRVAGLPDAELTVPFADTASAGLSEEARTQLLELAEKLRAHPDYHIQIVGHADARGSREFNLDLGGRRARAVTELLLRAGVSRQQLEMVSRGEDQPRVVGNSEQTWAANRRVEISIGMERSTTP